MPCWARIVVNIQDLQVAKDTLKHFGLGGNVTNNYDGTYSVDLTNAGVSEAQFKTEYGMRVVEKNARANYRGQARIWRGVNEKNEQTVFIKPPQ